MRRVVRATAVVTVVAAAQRYTPRPSSTPRLSSPPRPSSTPTAACSWGGATHAYSYNLTTALPGPRQCFPNVYGVGAPLEFPYPRSSYNYDLDPPVVGPRITAQWSDRETNSTVLAYDYETFESTGGDLLYRALPDAPGVYTYAVQAFDYTKKNQASPPCTSCLAVTDYVRPYAVLPRDGLCGATMTRNYSVDALQAADDQVLQLLAYRRTAANNDACSGRRCDTVRVTQTSFLSAFPTSVLDGAGSAVDATPDGWLGCLRAPLSDRERQRLTTPLAYVTDARVCKRTCAYFVGLQELYTPFTCNAKVVPTPICAGDASESCSLTQSLVLPSSDLVSCATVSLQPTGPHLLDPEAAFPGAGYLPPSARHLHLTIPCYHSNASFASYCDDVLHWRVSDLFAFSTTLAPSQPWGLDSAASLVTWFVQQGDRWVAVDDSKALTFSKFRDTLTFRAMTACGQVSSDVTWTVFSHRSEAISIDAWWNSLWSCSACNEPGADFGVCRFRLDPNSALHKAMLEPSTKAPSTKKPSSSQPPRCEYRCPSTNRLQSCARGCLADSVCDPSALPGDCAKRRGAVWCGSKLLEAATPKYTLLGINCAWQYPNATMANWSIPVNAAIDTAFAIKLLNRPTTTIIVACTFEFQPNMGEPVVSKTRSLSVDMQNCDRPRFDDSHALAFVKDNCSASWELDHRREPAPAQACGGHLVFPDTPDAQSTVLLTPAKDIGCCNSAVSTFACQSLKSHPSIKQCRPTSASVIARDALAIEQQSVWHPMAAGFLVCAAVAVAVTVRHRQAACEADESAYMALL
ncbi:hypothetical protein SDRG_16745 [Saprolegnia diclina VS20]|uniref:Uncharacterized protein n=1 Tax=Saprolegnia diclina (strain VS20) TaxID=1156394 RepID=T0R7B2_SAPDV|nr:hypothetical protein SDRG_16745 [Saprolegnia diclina VS20]EQC25382.1 hypothetical protein SDRG_16745 [Saprolegnia diclina VS20]|eukprot:XP_008621184.1 hypothetical protein SDRG_16745 [Saprolegnia diclina VS20]